MSWFQNDSTQIKLILKKRRDLGPSRPTRVCLHSHSQQDVISNNTFRLFDSGVLHYYDYGHLYNPGSKIVVRTTTQDRVLKSAEDFLAGFFGLDYTKNATLELMIEANGFNNTLGGNLGCPNANLPVSAGGTNASVIWENKYLAPAVQRFQALSENFKWNISDAYG